MNSGSVISEVLFMSKQEREDLQRALRQLALENNSREKVIRLFKEDGYFDADGKLAKEYRESE